MKESSLFWHCSGVGYYTKGVLLKFVVVKKTEWLVLDDALVMFDDDRLRLALRLLQREAENRQILLFTCQHREQKALTTDL